MSAIGNAFGRVRSGAGNLASRAVPAPVRERIAQGRLRASAAREKLLENWSRLSERDQQIVTIGGIGGSIALGVLILFMAAGHLNTLRRDIDKRSKLVVEMREMRAEYRAAKGRLDAINDRLRANNTPPRSFLEEKAGEVNVKQSIESMEERAAPPNDLFKAQVIEVRLKKVTLANLTRYLHKIESSGAGMTVRSLDASPNFQDAKYLDAKVQVQALRPKE